jgi:hypothetical protein
MDQACVMLALPAGRQVWFVSGMYGQAFTHALFIL